MPETEPVKLRLRLLGGAEFCISGEAGERRLATVKGIALLAYLAMNGARPIGRGVLADLLWGDRVDRQARQNLRQCVMTVRRDLGAAAAGLLVVDDRYIRLNLDAVEVDALEFAACATAEDLPQRLRCLDIPWGPFLDGFFAGADVFDSWAEGERHRLAALATRTFAELAERCDACGDGERAIAAMEKLVAIDPTEEERHRRLLALEARYRGGDALLARAKSLADLLKREVDAEPEPATSALIEELRRTNGKPKPVEPAAASPAPEPPPLPPFGPVADESIGQSTFEIAPQSPEPRSRRWFAEWHRPQLAFAVVALITTVGAAVILWTMSDPAPTPLVARAPAPTSLPLDPWRTPPLPSGRNEQTGEGNRGIIPIAVLPFTSYEPNGSSALVAEMVTDDLTNVLSRIRSFRVISRHTARTYRRPNLDIASLATELGVQYAIEGTARIQDGNLRVAVELIDPAMRTVMWSTRVERPGSDRRAVLDEIVARLARELHITSYALEGERRSHDEGADALAYRGMTALQNAFTQISLEAYEPARALFAQALERDPKHFMARLGLSSYHGNVAAQRLVPEPAAHLDTAFKLVSEVLHEDPRIAGAHQQLGMVLQASGKLREAIEAFERAIELNPSNVGSYAHIGFALTRLGRAAEGIEHIRYAMRLGPKDPSLAIWSEFAGCAELELGQHEAAIASFSRATSITRAYPRPWAGLAAAFALAGREQEALTTAERLRALAPGLSTDQLVQRFGRGGDLPRVREGLRMALTLQSAG